ncbi:S8 family peptidase [Jatrophihabitans fulvus]
MRSTSRGAYRAAITAGATPAVWRFRAPAVAVKKGRKTTRYAQVTTHSRTIVGRKQSGALTAVSWTEPDKPVSVVSSFTPARRDRVVRLQSLVDGSWRTVASARQNVRGAAVFVRSFATGIVRLRAVSDAFHGAGAVATPGRAVVAGARQAIARSVDVVAGSEAVVDLGGVVTTLSEAATVTKNDVSVVTRPAGALAVSATTDATEGDRSLLVDGSGCYENACEIHFRLTLGVHVTPLASATPSTSDFTAPSTDRVAAATTLPAGVRALGDELIVTLGSPQNPGSEADAVALAADVGAVVSGGLGELGIFELRWTQPPADLDAVAADLRSRPAVSSVTRSTFDTAGIQQAPPGDWDDDGKAVTWPFDQMRAQQAWGLSTGNSTPVGILDAGTVFDHEDLNVAQRLGNAAPAMHATHVAGLACAAANGKGVVGVSWGCPITSSGLSGTSDKHVLAAAYRMAKSGVSVVNMSLGYNLQTKQRYCSTQSISDATNDLTKQSAGQFRQLFNGPVGRNIVWTISAGNNCAVGPASPWGADWTLPNVITVAASNSDGSLASYSNFGAGVEVAAPGGVGVGIAGGAGGPISTVPRKCGLFGWSTCSDYKPDTGTSMAAPMVAGVAALAFAAGNSISAADVGSCIVSTAGEGSPTVSRRGSAPATAGAARVSPLIPFTGSLPVVDARAAVECARGTRAGSADILIAGGGDRTSSGNGTDLGDLTAALEARGYRVATSVQLPDDLRGFGQVWYVDTDAMTPEQQSNVEGYIRAGHSVYLTGEWGCCTVDQSSISIINDLVPNATVSHASGGTNTPAIRDVFGLASSPNAVNSVTLASSGSLTGVPDANIVADTGDPTLAAIAAFGPDDVTGRGKIAIVMDINWLAEQYRGSSWDGFVGNLARFLA